MSSNADYFTLEELQEIKSQIEWYGVDLIHFKNRELLTLEICKDISCFNGEAWLSDDIQAGRFFQNKLGSGKPLCYMAGILQWGKVYGRETSYVGLYYMLNKVFIAADTPQGSFDSDMAAILDKSSEEEAGMYLVCLYEVEDLQWLFKVVGQRAVPIPLAYHDDASYCEGGWWEYHNKCLHILLQMSGDGCVILSSQLTGIRSLARPTFDMRWEYGPCCLLFKRGDPSCFVPLDMTNITVSGSSASQSQMSMLQAPTVTSGLRWSSEGSASRLQTSSHPASSQMFTGAKDSFSQASGGLVVPESPGIPEDFKVQQPKSRSAKKRRISGGQTTDEQADPVAAFSCARKGVMENIGDRIAFNQVAEEFCQMEKLHMLEVVAVADRAYTEVLKSFPNFLSGSSITVALVDTLVKAHEKHTLAILEGIE